MIISEDNFASTFNPKTIISFNLMLSDFRRDRIKYGIKWVPHIYFTGLYASLTPPSIHLFEVFPAYMAQIVQNRVPIPSGFCNSKNRYCWLRIPTVTLSRETNVAWKYLKVIAISLSKVKEREDGYKNIHQIPKYDRRNKFSEAFLLVCLKRLSWIYYLPLSNLIRFTAPSSVPV